MISFWESLSEPVRTISHFFQTWGQFQRSRSKLETWVSFPSGIWWQQFLGWELFYLSTLNSFCLSNRNHWSNWFWDKFEIWGWFSFRQLSRPRSARWRTLTATAPTSSSRRRSWRRRRRRLAQRRRRSRSAPSRSIWRSRSSQRL